MTDSMTGRCTAGDRCRGYRHDLKQPAWTNDGGPLCEDCLVEAERDIGRLLLDWRDLEEMLPKAAGQGEYVSGTRDAPVPLNLGVEALQAEILHVLTTWAEVMSDYADLADPPDGRARAGWAVQRAVTILQPRVRQLALIGPTEVFPTGPEDAPEPLSGVDAIAAMSRLHRRAHHQLGLTRAVTNLPGECSACGLATLAGDRGDRTALARDDGSDVVYCRACGAWQTRDEYDRDTSASVAYLRQQRGNRAEEHAGTGRMNSNAEGAR